jgi:4-hydroxy-tetrahydrodipicolinate synthase
MFLKGLYTAVVTPFNSQGKLDEQGLRHNFRFQIKNGVDGIVVLGTTGEAPTLSLKEKERIIQIGLEEIKGKAQFLVGTGTYSTEETIENTRLAEQLGADAALVVTPYYNKPTQEGLYQHFKSICQSVSIPICLYNIQGRTGQNLQTDTLKRLASFPNIIGVKEASGNILQINDVLSSVAHQHPHFSVVSGDDSLTLPLMALGGHGVISVVSNLIPFPMKKLVQACLQGDFKQAQSIQHQLLPLFRAAFIETNPIPIKAAMNRYQMAAGPCRLPLCDLTPENHEKLQAVIDKLPKEWLSQHG